MNQDQPLFAGQPNQAYDADAYKKNGYVRVSGENQSALWFTKGCCTCFTFLSAGVALILVLAVSATFGFSLQTSIDYRNGAGVAADGYPPVNQAGTGLWNVALTAAFVSILAFLGYLLVLLFHPTEVEQLQRGANPWVFAWLTLWTPVAFLVWALVSGVSDIYVLITLATLSAAWTWIYYVDDLLHSHAYRYTQEQAGGDSLADASYWSWIPWVLGFILILIVYIIIFVHLSFTFGAASPPAGALLFVPIIGMILYLGIPIILLLGNGRWLIRSSYVREMALYIYGGFVITVATWLSLAIFAST